MKRVEKAIRQVCCLGMFCVLVTVSGCGQQDQSSGDKDSAVSSTRSADAGFRVIDKHSHKERRLIRQIKDALANEQLDEAQHLLDRLKNMPEASSSPSTEEIARLNAVVMAELHCARETADCR